ncbi:MAG: phage tail tape measure C-terminal domain-containing protein [Pseudomonadota bacterium]
MDEFEQSLQSASDSLNRLVDGPGLEAAARLEQAFAQSGARIEQVFSRAARSGELDFRRMAESILADLARIVAEAVIAQSGLGQVGQTVNLNMSVGGGADARSVVGAAGSIASAVASAAARGARFA